MFLYKKVKKKDKNGSFIDKKVKKKRKMGDWVKWEFPLTQSEQKNDKKKKVKKVF